MTFLGFRHAKRKAKKIVTSRSLRSSTPSPDSFVSTSVVEIGDPTSASAEACYAPMTLHVDLDITPDPPFPSDPLFSTFRHHSSTTIPRQSQDRLPRSRVRESSPKPLQDDSGWVQPRDGRVARSAVVGDVIRTPDSRRAAKATPAPIIIPTMYHASKVQIQRSAGKPAELHPAPMNLGDSPVLEDTASAISGISLPAALITNVWTTQTDQPRDRHQSRRITRLDSATLPVDPFLQKYSGLNNGGGENHVPPMPLPIGVNAEAAKRPASERGKGDVDLGDKVQSGERNLRDPLLREMTNTEKVFSACKPSQTSLITEVTTPDPSDSGTPDLIKDSSTSADGGSSDAHPNTSTTSDCASSAWSGPQSSSSPGPRTSDHKLPSKESGGSPYLPQAGLPGERNDGSRTRFVGQRRTSATPDLHRRPLSRSSPRPSLASVILHPATLRPVSERRTSTHGASQTMTGTRVVAPDDADRMSALPSSLPAAHCRHISQLPSFPESAVHPSTPTSSGFSSSLSPPSSPDLLDSIVLESGRKRQRHLSRESTSTAPASGSTQTFPETPPVFSPMFSPGVGHTWGHTLSILDSSTRKHAIVARSLQGRNSLFISGRPASAKASIGTKARRKSSRSKLKRSSTGKRTPAIPSSLSTMTNSDVVTTTKSDQVQPGSDLSTHPQSVSSGDSPDSASFRRPNLYEHPESQRNALILLAFPPPPSQPLSPRGTAVKFGSNSTPLSLLSLPPPPSPPPPPVLQGPTVSPSPPLRGLSPSLVPRAHPPSADISSEDKSQARISLSYRYLTPPPPVLPSVTPPGNSLFPPSVSSGHVPVNPPLNAYNTDRPPRPLGPRAPYRNSSLNPGSRGRFLSNSSTASFPGMTVIGDQDLVSGRSSARCRSSSEPRFQTSPAKFKTFTMEAAMWTFTPEELHALMSQAIRGSGQASSIRLLSQQAASVEIPEELGRLNALLDELTVQYRLQVRKRNVLLRATYEYAENPEPCSISFRSKLQELHETALSLDRIAEEMYHARDQAAQLSRVLAVHSGSALAVTLRNLQSNYLKRTADVQILKDHLSALEAECDGAWAQAQQVARDLDDLNSALQTGSGTRPASRSSSRIVASRQSSLRSSKAGPRLSHSQRASTASQVGSSASAVSSPSSPSGLIPPVPGNSRRLASLSRISTTGLSSSQNSDLSSSSERRALAQAQADLYKCLGIDDPEPLPRSARRSFILTSPSTMSMSPVAQDSRSKEKALRRMSDITDHRGGGGLSDQFQAFRKDKPDTLLATVER